MSHAAINRQRAPEAWGSPMTNTTFVGLEDVEELIEDCGCAAESK